MFRTLFCKWKRHNKRQSWNVTNFFQLAQQTTFPIVWRGLGCVRASVCHSVHACGQTPIRAVSSSHLPTTLFSPLSINIACLHLASAPFDEALPVPSGGLTHSCSPHLPPSPHFWGRHSSDLSFDLLHHTAESEAQLNGRAVFRVRGRLCLESWEHEGSTACHQINFSLHDDRTSFQLKISRASSSLINITHLHTTAGEHVIDLHYTFNGSPSLWRELVLHLVFLVHDQLIRLFS